MQSSVLIKHHINTQTPVRNVCLKCTIEKKKYWRTHYWNENALSLSFLGGKCPSW